MTKTSRTTGISDLPRLDQSVEAIMSEWPATARVFIRRKMACVGCIMAPFQTLKAAARSYKIPEQQLLDEIRQAAAGGDPTPSAGPPATACLY
jgi:hybrid cluster-associated redox disulfide protein